MPYEIFLALKYLRVRRGRRVAGWTAVAAVVGIACGVAALVFALTLARGFRGELRDKILRGTAHVTVARAGGGSGVGEARSVAARLRGVEGVASAAPTSYSGALLSGPAGAAYAVLRGVDSVGGRAPEQPRRTVTAGSADALFASPPGAGGEQPANVLLGEELAERTGLVAVGAEGWLLTGEPRGGAEGFAARSRRVRVAGLFRTGLFEYDSAWAYLSLEEAGRAGAESAVVAVEARDIYASNEVAARVRSLLGPGWEAVDWREANRPLFSALELERRTVAVIIMLIMILAALNITTTLALVVVERRADIAVLGAIGARARGVMAVFVIEGALIGAAGAAFGVVLGLAACAAADYFGLVRLPPDVYSVSVVPLRPRAADVLLPALAALAVSLLATIYPALQAARLRPAEALRHEG